MKNFKDNHVIVILIFIATFIIAVVLHLFGIIESFQQFVVVLLSAAATYVIVAITLNKQNEMQAKLQSNQIEQQQKFQQELQIKQDEKDKELKTHEKKIEVYSEFVKAMWKDAAESDDEEIPESIRDLIFDKLIFYLDKETISSLQTLIDFYFKDNKPKKAKLYADITGLLKSEIEIKEEDKEPENESIRKLWSIINDNIAKDVQKVNNENVESINTPIQFDKNAKNVGLLENSESEVPPTINQKLNEQAWHFIMWTDEQLNRLKNDFKELSLVEYGEYWRTNLVKQVGENDVIMLFRRGGYGYIGAYKAIGWRVFYFEEEREEMLIFGEDVQIITGEKYLSDVKAFDIYESKDDGATTCANIIVEPFAFVENGVGNPGGVYRRTISRYDSHYAWLLKKKFQETGQWLES